MEKEKILRTNEEVKAISDPFRIKILYEIKKARKSVTVKQIAGNMKETPSKVYYHVKKLEKNGIVHIVKTEVINGIIAKFYELSADTFKIEDSLLNESFEKISDNERSRLISTVYMENMKSFMKSMKKYKAEKDQDNIFIVSSILELTDEEAKEIADTLNNIIEKYKDTKKGAHNEEYLLFYTFFKSSD